jgi:hypothetical protein
MSDVERIWLQSAEDTTALGQDRLWCEDKVWPESDEDHEPNEYVRADLFASLETEVAGLKLYAGEKSNQHVAAMEENKALRKALGDLIIHVTNSDDEQMTPTMWALVFAGRAALRNAGGGE